MTEKAEVFLQKTRKWRQVAAALSAAGGAFSVGAALGWPAQMGPKLTEGDPRYFPIDERTFDWASSIVTIGCAISCLPIGYLMQIFGRKPTMIALIAPFMVGWALVIWAQNFAMLFAGRLLLGIAGGGFCVSCPQYSSEIAEKEIRGFVGTFFQVLVNVGILFVYTIGAFMSVFWTSLICAGIPVIFGMTFVFVPESPVYLVTKKREMEAFNALKWFRGENYDPAEEINALKEEIEKAEGNRSSLREMLREKATQRALVIGFGLMIFQQFCAINIIIFYSTTIFKAAKTNIDSKFQTIIIGAVLLVATIFGSLLVDRVGRKILMVISSAVMTVMLAALGTYFFLLGRNSDVIESLFWLPLTSLCIHLIGFSVGYGPLPWLLISECYRKSYNAVASPITCAFAWTLGFVVTLTFGYITEEIGIGQTLWVFAGLSLVGVFFSHFVLVETKAKTFSEIQQALAGN